MTDPSPTACRRSVRFQAVVLLSFAILLGMLILVRLLVGQRFGWPEGDVPGAIWRVFGGAWVSGPTAYTTLDVRLLRVGLAVVVGASLSVSGVALQALLRNVLAEPFVLGLSSGAALGVMAQMAASYRLDRPVGPGYLGALVGAWATMGIVYAAGRKRGAIDPIGLLLVGVVINTINGAAIMVLNQMAGPAGIYQNLSRWMMGYLNESVTGTPALAVFTLVLLAGFVLLQRSAPAIDAATFSDSEAMSLGVDLSKLRLLLFLVASALAAGAVVLAGPIAFVGLICPHGARLLLGPGHRTLFLGAALLGAILILVADTAAVCIDFSQGIGLLPIGVFTALIGGPAFVWMLRSQLGRGL